MARALDYSSYGSYGQTILVVTLFSAILSAGLSQIIFVYLNSDKKKETLSNNVLAGVFLGAIGTIILLITSPFISRWLGNPVLETLIYIYSFSLVFIIPNQSFNSFLIFSNKVKTSMKLILSINLLKIFLVVIAIQLYQSVFFALLGIAISQFILFFINVLILKDSLILGFNFKLIFEQIKKGFPLGLTALAGTLILYTDGIMISKMCGVETYAIYRNGAIEVPFISTLYGAVAAIILPEVAKLFSQGKFKEIATLKKKIIMNTMMIPTPTLECSFNITSIEWDRKLNTFVIVILLD
jgi:O-antigen/teichoic acid export membrane protein